MKLASLSAWIDNQQAECSINNSSTINWIRCLPFLLLHLSLGLVLFIKISIAGVVICFLSYFIRMFAITGFFHRYFSHKTFSTTKSIEIIFAFIGTCSAQRGPIWWASHHRAHHKHSDTPQDQHTPIHHSFLRSHMGWFMSNKNFHVQKNYVKDLEKKPHLQLIDRFDGIIPLIYLAILAIIGYCFEHYTHVQLTPFSAMFWGFSVSTILLLHATFAINSIGHLFGNRTYNTMDESRNNLVLALITLGEGWHNNHHHWPISAKQGFHWQQIDISYWMLCLMKKLHLISDIKNIPNNKINKNKVICASQS